MSGPSFVAAGIPAQLTHRLDPPHSIMVYRASRQPTSQSFPSTVDNAFRASNTRTSATLDRGGEEESGSPLPVASDRSSVRVG